MNPFDYIRIACNTFSKQPLVIRLETMISLYETLYGRNTGLFKALVKNRLDMYKESLRDIRNNQDNKNTILTLLDQGLKGNIIIKSCKIAIFCGVDADIVLALLAQPIGEAQESTTKALYESYLPETEIASTSLDYVSLEHSPKTCFQL